jgi:chromosome segregation ATPase
MNLHRSAALVSSLALLASFTAQAQVQRSGGEAQKFMQQYQQLSSEKTALQAQLEQMKKDLDGAKTELTAVQKERDALKKRPPQISETSVAQLTASKNAAEKSLETYKQRMEELVGRFRETATNLKDIEADRARLRQALDTRNAAYDKCASDNLSLRENRVVQQGERRRALHPDHSNAHRKPGR